MEFQKAKCAKCVTGSKSGLGDIMSLHSFDPAIAAKVGLNAAVIYQNIIFWTRKNAANGRHIHDGHVWTYNSVKALNELFDYLTPNQIRTAIGKLIEAELIAEGNYNQSAYDRTKWYGVPSQVHLGESTNGSGENHKPIPDSKPDSKPDTPLKPPQGGDASKPKRRKPSVQIPEDWTPDQATALRLKTDHNLTNDELQFCFEQMRDDAHAKDKRFADWNRAFATWVRNSVNWGRVGPGSKRRNSQPSASGSAFY